MKLLDKLPEPGWIGWRISLALIICVLVFLGLRPAYSPRYLEGEIRGSQARTGKWPTKRGELRGFQDKVESITLLDSNPTHAQYDVRGLCILQFYRTYTIEVFARKTQ